MLLAIAGLALVAGATLPVLPWLVHHVPGFALMRIPGRYKLLAAWRNADAALPQVAAAKAWADQHSAGAVAAGQ